jgi:tetratricopeptide (TPR) repeat protein
VAIGARRNADAELSATVERALEAELGSWPDVDVVERVDRSDPTGVVLAVDAAALEDSVRIMVESRAAGTAPVRRTWVVPRRALATTATAATIVRRSLGGATSDLAPGLDAMPGRSLAALAAYVRGWDLLRAGRLDSAQASLHEAASVAPGFAEASLWAAQSGAWASPNVPSTWKDDAEAAAAGRLLTATDSLHAAALRAMAMRDYPAACRAFGEAARREPSTFAAWFGLAECARLDTVVVGRGERARFRSSHWAALRAYREAVARAPTSELLSVLFPRVLQTTYAGGSIARHGRGEDGHPYSALPSAAGDSIALVPVDRTAFGGLGRSAVPSTYLAAVRRGRAVALELTASWTRRWPTSSDAWFNRALALELAGRIDGGDPGGSALAALDRARSPAPSALARARIAVAQARLGLRRLDLAGAAATARGAIAGVWPKDSTVQTTLAPLAALVGDVARTEELAAVGELEPSIGSPELAREIRAFEIRAISGACDGLDTLRERLEGRLRVAFAPAELRSQRAAILAPIYRDAVPCLGPSILGEFPATRPIDSVFRSMAVGDTVQAVRLLATLRQRRVGANAASVTWDYLFVESWALAHVGDGKMARAQLATALSDLANMSVYTLDQVAQAAGLRRALGLMAQLEQEAGASGGDAAARWASQSRLLSPTPER